jgi:hypothetical protein
MKEKKYVSLHCIHQFWFYSDLKACFYPRKPRGREFFRFRHDRISKTGKAEKKEK